MSAKVLDVYLFGDSVGEGVIFNEKRNRYTISKQSAVNKYKQVPTVNITSYAKMGDTIIEGLQRIEGIKSLNNALTIIEYGSNDCNMPWKDIAENPSGKYNGKIPIEIYTDKLNTLIDKVISLGGKPILVTPLPLIAEQFFNWVTKGLDKDAILSFLGDVQHIYRWQERYAFNVVKTAYNKNIKLLDLRDLFLSQDNYFDLMCCDGMHPNDIGQKLIADYVEDKIPALI